MRRRRMSRLITASATLLSAGCKTSSLQDNISSETLSLNSPEQITGQFDATEMVKCIDEDGKSTGSLNAIWRLKNSSGQKITPYIESFSGSVRSLTGEAIEFQSLFAVEEKQAQNPIPEKLSNFPHGGYSVYKLVMLEDELEKGFAQFKVNGLHKTPSDFSTLLLYIPRFAIGGEYSTRYYLKTDEERVYELSCQAMSDQTRARLTTFAAKEGLHGFTGSRGTRAELFSGMKDQSRNRNDRNTSERTIGDVDLARISENDHRPVNRPVTYDKTFKHTRLFECQKEGSLDAIWRIADSTGKPIPADGQFMTGFSGELQDKMTGKKISFNAVTVDPAPPFYSGKMPPSAQFFFPAILFSEDDFNKNIAAHSQLGSIDGGFISGGGTVFIPRDGSGRAISVSLSLGKSLRGEPFQVTAQCKPVRKNISDWMNYCLGEENRKSAGTACQP